MSLDRILLARQCGNSLVGRLPDEPATRGRSDRNTKAPSDMCNKRLPITR